MAEYQGTTDDQGRSRKAVKVALSLAQLRTCIHSSGESSDQLPWPLHAVIPRISRVHSTETERRIIRSLLQASLKLETDIITNTPRTLRTTAIITFKMSPQATRFTSLISRRAFHATRARLSSPYHYPEGPYSNLPFNTKTRFFAVRYWAYCITGFFLPFGIAVWQTKKPKA
ncbi:hypothetical protein F5Y15DRAFT_426413 [Xylariaceae sp. FL0016]|nr:hypothetical protein F5Y15DRAFT_426413 [Xylariaceae sp. FL0016]